jgi:hypothetical protein
VTYTENELVSATELSKQFKVKEQEILLYIIDIGKRGK